MTGKNGKNSVTFEDRVRGALWGGLIGDAYCLGSHWIYSLTEITQRFPGGIKGFETPAPGHYHYGKQNGDFTHYGDADLLMLKSVAELGRFDAADFGRRFMELMTGRDYKGYLDHATKETIANYQAYRDRYPEKEFDYQQGGDDDQPATITRLAPVVVAHLNDQDLLGTIAKATRVCQNNVRTIAFTQAAALILRSLLYGENPETAVEETRKIIKPPDKSGLEVNRRMKVACAARILQPSEAIMLFGQSCPLYSSFTAALHTTLTCSNSFEKAMRVTAESGGDSAGRAAMAGAWLGAHLGIQAIPEAWQKRLNAHDQIESDVEKIIAGMTSGIRRFVCCN